MVHAQVPKTDTSLRKDVCLVLCLEVIAHMKGNEEPGHCLNDSAINDRKEGSALIWFAMLATFTNRPTETHDTMPNSKNPLCSVESI